ncbi:MAG: MoxR family ATPase [Verrucomicrobiota bacterium]
MESSNDWAEKIRQEVGKTVIGQELVVERLLVALLANGHVLLEGMPGLAKTLLVKSLGSALGVQFERIQFTPDLLPSDVVGTMIYQPGDGSFSAHLGPVFANLVLADEINRSPAKVQSALLEGMQERQVTIGGQSHQLPSPFFVMATQNPVEQEGTYPLPEAQVDRFLFKLLVEYPSYEEERTLMNRWGKVTEKPEIEPISTGEELLAIREEVDAVHLSEEVQTYILDLVRATRQDGTVESVKKYFSFGASPRASLALTQAGRALAWLRGSDFVSPSHIQDLYLDVMRHRVGLTYEAEAEEIRSDEVLQDVLQSVRLPGPVEA